MFCLVACSSKPSEVDIGEQLKQKLINGPSVQLMEFHKTNGYEKGDGTYVVEVSYKLRFKQSLDDFATQMYKLVLESQEGSQLIAMRQLLGSFDKKGTMLDAMIFGQIKNQIQKTYGYGQFKVDDVIEKNELLNFIKSEKGWMLAPE